MCCQIFQKILSVLQVRTLPQMLSLSLKEPVKIVDKPREAMALQRMCMICVCKFKKFNYIFCTQARLQIVRAKALNALNLILVCGCQRRRRRERNEKEEGEGGEERKGQREGHVGNNIGATEHTYLHPLSLTLPLVHLAVVEVHHTKTAPASWTEHSARQQSPQCFLVFLSCLGVNKKGLYIAVSDRRVTTDR